MLVTVNFTPMCSKKRYIETYECDEIKGGVFQYFENNNNDSEFPNENVCFHFSVHDVKNDVWHGFSDFQIISIKIEDKK